jgi:hypothetical protein
MVASGANRTGKVSARRGGRLPDDGIWRMLESLSRGVRLYPVQP